MKAILLIGGFGTRLRPLTVSRPKALLPILNKPFLAYQLDMLAHGGAKHVVLSCGRHLLPFRKAMAKLAPKGVKLTLAFEQQPLGTGGAIRFAYDAFRSREANEPVLVFNGDVFLNLDLPRFAAFHRKSKADATIALTEVADVSRFGVALFDKKGQIRRFIEKPQRPVGSKWINAGAYCLNSRWIKTIPTGRPVSIEKESFPGLLDWNGRLFGFQMQGYWNDIGTHATYLRAHRDLLFENNRWTHQKYLRKRAARVVIGKKSSIASNVRFEGFVSIGSGVVVEADSTIKNSILLDGVRVGAQSRIDGGIVGFGSRLGSHVTIEAGAVLGDKSVIPDYTTL